MIKVTVVGFVSALALCAGSLDKKDQDLAKCKLRAIELYRPPADEAAWSGEPLAYLRTCMRATGYWWNDQSSDCSSMLDRTFFPRCWH
jgi:hypothetical protein